MPSHKLAFIAVAFACVCAAAAGGYLATRQNQASSAMAATATPAAAAPVTTAGANRTASDAVAPSRDAGATTRVAEHAPAAAKESVSARRTATPASTVAKNMPAAPGLTASQTVPPFTSQPSTPQPEPVAPPAPLPDTQPAPRPDDIRAPEPPKAFPTPPAPEKTFDELVVSADSVIGVQLDKEISSEKAKIEDVVDARVIRDVRVGSHVAIPAGSRLIGSVTVVERGGKFKDRARLGIRFNTLVLADGSKIPISTETIYRTGDAPGNGTAAKIGGGAVVGTILGGILGGAKGAAVGAAAGAGGGAAATAAGDRSVATFPAGTQMTARFAAPVTITVEENR